MSLTPTYNDHYHRLQLFMCCIADKGYSVSKKLRISNDCCCEIEELERLMLYWFALECYNPDLQTNCLTQTQVDDIWSCISKICGLCFAPYGSTYTQSNTGSRLISGGGDRVVDENGNYVIG